MESVLKARETLEKVTTVDLWIELARRFGVRFGNIQMAIRDGRPSAFATIDMKIKTTDDVAASQV